MLGSPTLRVLAMLGAALAAVPVTWLLGKAAPRLLGYRSSTAVAVIVAASAVLAALAPGDPTGILVTDALYRAAFGAAMALFASRARRTAWLVAAGLAAVGAHANAWGFAGFALLGIAAGATSGRRWGHPAAALWGAALAQALLRMTWPEPIGLTAAMGTIAAAVLGVSWYRQAPRAHRRIARGAVAALTTASAVLIALAALSGLTARAGLTRGVDAAEDGLAAARNGELSEAADRFDQAGASLLAAHRDLSTWWARPARLLPVAGRYLADADALTVAGADVAQRAGPVARRTGTELRVVDGGVDLAALRELRTELAGSILALDEAHDRVRTPSAAAWTPGPLRHRYDRLATRLRDGLEDARVLLTGVDLAPHLLGDDGSRRWLLTVFTPAEQRTNGGLLGNYGELVAEDGRVRVDRFGRVSRLEGVQRQRQATLPPELAEAFARYGDQGITSFLRNAMQTPDFSLTASALEHLYPQLDGAPVGGTVAVDPTGLAALLEVTGPVSVATWPEPITADNAEHILYFEHYVRYEDDDIDPETGDIEREDFLGEVARAVIDRLTSGDLGPPSVLVQALAPAVAAGHVMFHSAVAEEQAFFASVGAAGVVAPPDGGDFIRVATQNASQSKLEWFLHRTVRYQPVYDPVTGEVRAHLEVELRNDAPPGGLPSYILGAGRPGFPPPAHSRLRFTVYSPLGLVGAEIAGKAVLLTQEREVGYNAYGGYVDVPPQSRVLLTLELRGVVSGDTTYRLRIGSQPQVHPDELAVEVRAAPGWEAVDDALLTAKQAGELEVAVTVRQP